MKNILHIIIVLAAAAIVSVGWFFFSKTDAAQNMVQNRGGEAFSLDGEGHDRPEMGEFLEGGKGMHQNNEAWAEGAVGMPERGSHGSQGVSFSGIWRAFSSSFVKLLIPTVIISAIVISVQWTWRKISLKRKATVQS